MGNHVDRRTSPRRRRPHPPIESLALSTFVIDASAAFRAVLPADGFAPFRGHDLKAPPLLWSEVSSVLRESVWRREISRSLAEDAIDRLLRAPIERRAERRMYREAMGLAHALGWAKTYDAEYVALARLLRCPLVTIDGRLARGASRLIEVVPPADLVR